LEKASNSTFNERKQMSTKTSIKRIALVAVSALGFGLLSVVPAKANGTISATVENNATVFRADYDSVQLTVTSAGLASGAKIYATWTATSDATSAPAINSVIANIDAGGANSDIDSFADALDDSEADEAKNSENASGWITAAGTEGYGLTGSTNLLHIDNALIDSAGAYSVRLWADVDGSVTFNTGDISTTYSWTAGGDIDAASCTLTPVTTSGYLEDEDDQEVTLSCTLTDEDGNRTREDGTDDLQWTATYFNTATAQAAGSTDSNLADSISTDENGGSGLYIDAIFTNDALEAAAPAEGARLAAGITLENGSTELLASTSLLIYAYNKENADNTITVTATSAADLNISGASVGGTSRTITALESAATIYFTISGAAASKYYRVTTANVSSATAALGMTHTNTFQLTRADGTVTFGITNTTPVAGEKYTVTIYEDGTTDPSFTVTYADDEPTLTKYTPDASFSSKTGATHTLTVLAKDGAGAVLKDAAYTVVVTGRNPSNAAGGKTDANGLASFTLTDSSAATTTDKPTDTVTFTVTDADGDTASTAYTVTYTTTGPVVGSITMTETSGNGAADGDLDADRNMTVDPVVALGSAAATSYATVTATLKGATGAPSAAGIVVTFSGGADDLFGTTAVVANMKKTIDVTTSSAGQAQVYVYRTKTGATTVTATAAGVSATSASLTWLTVDSYARTIEVSADPAKAVSEGTIRIVGTVKDRYGNVVPGVDVAFSEIGAGRLVSSQDASETTGATGQVAFDMTSNAKETGTGSVTLEIAEATQSTDPAGKVGTTLVSGVTAGVDSASVAIEFTADTSVSTADALLELAKAIGTSKSVDEAADAAAEAIDAANAATDAATVAAEEARDAADSATAAVEELATQVATLMAALKAQLTTLANTVAKIAKKVKA